MNVNAQGNNILNDAANEPSIAIDPSDPDRIVIGWRQFDNVSSNFRQAGWAYSNDGGQTWTFPGVLEPGVFRSDPLLGANGTGTFFYNSLQGDFCIDVWRSDDGGVTWPIAVDAFGGDKAWMDVDQRTSGAGAGNIYSSWSFGGQCMNGQGLFTRSTDGGATWMTPIDIPGTPVFGTVAVGPDGEVVIAGVDFPTFFNTNFVVVRSTDAKDHTVTPTFDFSVTGNFLGGGLLGGGSPNPDGLMGQVWVAINPTVGPNRGHVYMLCSVDPSGSDPLDIKFSRSVDGGMTWSAPVRVNDDSTSNGAWQWFGTMSVAPNGRIDAVWNDTRDDPGNNLSRVYYAYSVDEGVTWTANVPLTPQWDSTVGFPNQNKIGDYYDMESDLGGAGLAYAATFNNEEDVYFMRITVDDCDADGTSDADEILGGSPDCDTNGIPDECQPDCDTDGTPDACELAPFGSSVDCNNNDVPDECEPQDDCNTNGTPDFCDIATLASGDCNANDTPDECEVPPLGGGDDCNMNLVPDECESQADCNTNGTLDICDLFDGTSLDCNDTDVPDECELDGTEILLEEDFEAGGLPSGWNATGLWHVTGACPRPEEQCDGVSWAYYGQDGNCNFNTGAANLGTMMAASIAIPAEAELVTLTYCSAYGGQGGNSNTSGLDWAWVSVNGTEVDDVSLDGSQQEWETRSVDLTAYAGQTITIEWKFDSRTQLLNVFLGWEVDHIELSAVVTGSLDCNDNIIPDACELAGGAPDCNENGVLDECEAPVECPCSGVLGDMNVDLQVDSQDIQGMVFCLIDGDPATVGCACADVDDSGVIDELDGDIFVDCLLIQVCP